MKLFNLNCYCKKIDRFKEVLILIIFKILSISICIYSLQSKNLFIFKLNCSVNLGNKNIKFLNVIIERKSCYQDVKNCIKVCTAKNPFNGYKYLCVACVDEFCLMQWYDPLNNFMLLKVIFVLTFKHLFNNCK